MEIQRYKMDLGNLDDDGDMVAYSDHLLAVKEAVKEATDWERLKVLFSDEIDKAVAEAVEKERERCIKTAEIQLGVHEWRTAKMITDAIRSGEEP